MRRQTQKWLNEMCAMVDAGRIDNRTMADAILRRTEKAIAAGAPAEVVEMLQGEYRHAVREHENQLVEAMACQ